MTLDDFMNTIRPHLDFRGIGELDLEDAYKAGYDEGRNQPQSPLKAIARLLQATPKE